MPAGFVQSLGGNYGPSTSGGVTVTLTLTVNTTADNMVVIVGKGASGIHPTSAADSKGNTYQVDTSTTTGAAGGIVSGMLTTALLVGDTITVTFSASGAIAAVAAEYTGVTNTGVVVSTPSDGSGTTGSPGSAAVTGSGNVAIIGVADNSGTITVTPPAGFTTEASYLYSTGASGTYIMDEDSVGAGTLSPANVTFSASCNHSVMLAVYPPSSGGVVTAAAALSATAAATMAALVTELPTVALSATSQTTVAAGVTELPSVSLAADSTLTTSTGELAAVTLSATSGATMAALVTELPTASLTATTSLTAAAASGASIGLVQTLGSANGGATVTWSPSANTSAGNQLFLLCKGSGGVYPTGATDTAGNTWVVDSRNAVGSITVAILRTLQGTGLTPTDVVTITYTASGANTVMGAEYTGITATGVVTNAGVSASSVTTANIATMNAPATNSVSIVAAAWNLTTAFTNPAGYIAEESNQQTATQIVLFDEVSVPQGATGGVTINWTTVANFAAVQAIYAPTASVYIPMAATAALTPGVVDVVPGVVNIDAEAALTADAQATGFAALTADSTLTVIGTIAEPATVPMTASSTMTIGAPVGHAASVALTASAGLSPTAVDTRAITAAGMTVTAALTVAAASATTLTQNVTDNFSVDDLATLWQSAVNAAVANGEVTFTIGPVGGPGAFVQNLGGFFSSTNANPLVYTPGKTTTAGNLLVIVARGSQDNYPSSATDSKGNTYPLITDTTTGCTIGLFVGVMKKALTATDTITVDYTGNYQGAGGNWSNQNGFCVAEFTSMLPGANSSTSTSGSAATSATLPALTATANGMTALMGLALSVTAPGVNTPAGYTTRSYETATGMAGDAWLADAENVAQGATPTYTVTWATSCNYSAALALMEPLPTGSNGTNTAQLSSPNVYNFTGSYVFAKFVLPDSGVGSSIRLYVEEGATNNQTDLNAQWDDATQAWTLQNRTAGTSNDADVTVPAAAGTTWWVAIGGGPGANYFGTNGTSGQVNFFTSPDGINWTLQKNTLTPAWVAGVNIGIEFFNGTASPGPWDQAVVSNFNVFPIVGPTGSLQDPFTSSATLTSIWTASTTGTYAPVIGGGMAQVPYNSSSPILLTGGEYDLTASAVQAQITASTATGAVSTMLLQQASGSLIELTVTNGLLGGSYKQNNAAAVNFTGITYDPVAMAWWRIMDGGNQTLIFQTSPDGGQSNGWTTQFTCPWTAAMDFQVGFQAGIASGSPTGYVVVQNLNIFPGQVQFVGLAGLTIAGDVPIHGAAALSAGSGMTLTGAITPGGVTVPLASSAGLVIESVDYRLDAVAMNSLASLLTTIGGALRQGAVTQTATASATLSATVSPGTSQTVILTATTTMSEAATAQTTAAAALTATTTLSGTITKDYVQRLGAAYTTVTASGGGGGGTQSTVNFTTTLTDTTTGGTATNNTTFTLAGGGSGGTSNPGVTSLTVPITSASQSASNTLIAAARGSSGAVLTSVTDTRGNSWTLDSPTQSSNDTLIIARAPAGATLGTSDSVTFNFSSNTTPFLAVVWEFAYINTPVLVDATSQVTDGTAVTSVALPGATMQISGDDVITVMTYDGTPTATAPANFILWDTYAPSGPNATIVLASRQHAVTGTTAPTWTLSTGTTAAAAQVAYVAQAVTTGALSMSATSTLTTTDQDTEVSIFVAQALSSLIVSVQAPDTTPKMGQLADNFAQNDLAAVWSGSTGVTVANSRADLTASDGVAILSTPVWHDLTSSYMYCKLTTPSDGLTGMRFALQSGVAGGVGNDYNIEWDYTSNTWKMEYRAAGVDQDTAVQTVTAAAGQVIWFAIAEGTGADAFGITGVPDNVYFFSSPDGVTWTLQKTSATATWAFTAIPIFEVFNTGSTGVGTVTDVNTGAITTQVGAIALSGVAGMAMTAARSAPTNVLMAAAAGLTAAVSASLTPSNMTGIANLSVAAANTEFIAVAETAESVLALTVLNTTAGAMAETATTALAVATGTLVGAAVALVSTTVLTIAAVSTTGGSVVLMSATTTLTPLAAGQEFPTVALTSTAGMVSAMVNVDVAAVTYNGAEAALTVSATAGALPNISLVGTSGLVITAVGTTYPTLTLASASAMSVGVVHAFVDAVALTASGTLQVITVNVVIVAIALTAAGTQTTSASNIVEAETLLTGAGVLNVSTVNVDVSVIAVTATAGMTVSVGQTRAESVALSAAASFSLVLVNTTTVIVAMNSPAGLTITAGARTTGVILEVSTAAVAISAIATGGLGIVFTALAGAALGAVQLTIIAAVAMTTSTSTLQTAATNIPVGGVGLAGATSLTITSRVTMAAVVSSSADAGLTVSIAATNLPGVNLSSGGSLLVTMMRTQFVTVAQAASAVLTVTAVGVVASVIDETATASGSISALNVEVSVVALTASALTQVVSLNTITIALPLAAAAALSLVVIDVTTSTVTLASVSTVTVAAIGVEVTVVELRATGDITVTSVDVIVEAVILAANATLTPRPAANIPITMALTSLAVLTLASLNTTTDGTALAASAALVATAVGYTAVAAALTAQGALTPATIDVTTALVALLAQATDQMSALNATSSGATMSSTASLATSVANVVIVALAYAVTAALQTVTTEVATTASVEMTAEGVFRPKFTNAIIGAVIILLATSTITITAAATVFQAIARLPYTSWRALSPNDTM